MEHLYSAIKLFLRRRISSQEHLHFEPILSLIDLTCLSLGPVLGVGIFSILTYSSKYYAGPSSLLSFLIAAVASCLGGLCFTELATRFPNSGPSYSYIYMTLGELPSFLIAWAMHLEYAFCSALSMRSFVQYVQFLMNQTSNNSTNNRLNDQQKNLQQNLIPYLYDSYTSSMQSTTHLSDTYQLHHSHHSKMNPVPENTEDDLRISAFLILLFSIVFLLKTRSIKTTCFINNLFTFFGFLLIAGLFLVCTIYFVRVDHWTSEAGFFSNGIHGVFNGAGICFVSFIGFDIICSNVVNCKNVERSLPSAISLSFLLSLISTFLCTVIYTLSASVSMQDTFASFAQLFTCSSLFRMQYLIVLTGFLVAISATISLFRANNLLLMHLASHGLLPKFFYQSNECKFGLNNESKTNIYVQTPMLTSLATFLFFICVAIAFNNDSIICMLGLGTLLNYASSALAVLLLRYNKLEKLPLDSEKQTLMSSQNSINSNYSLNLQCSKCLNLNKFYSQSNKSSFTKYANDCPFNDQQSVQKPGLQLIVALPTSFYYRQYYKQTFDKIKKSWSDCHLQSKTCSLSSFSNNPIIPEMKVANSNLTAFNPIDENIIYQQDLKDVQHDQRNENSNCNKSQLTSCYVDKNYSSSLEFDFNLNYLSKLPTIQTEIKVKYILFVTILLMIGMGLCTSRNDQLFWLMSTIGIKPSYWPIELISCLFSAGIIYQLFRLSKQPIHKRKDEKNSLPCVPLLPICALWMQLHLALCLSLSAWITFLIWSLIGFFVYMSFSIWHSKEGNIWNSEESDSNFKKDEEPAYQTTIEETEHILEEEEEMDEYNFN